MIVALGANLSQGASSPAQTLEAALERLAARPGLRVAARSRWVRSAAVPAGSGPDFVNGAARVEGFPTAAAALATLHEVEAALGRRRPARWAPRVCDLDLIAAGAEVLPDADTVRRWIGIDAVSACRVAPQELILPHPRMQERAFVLVPMAEIAPGWRHPVLGLTVREMLSRLPAADRDAVRPL